MTAIWLDDPVTTATYAWRLERADGVTLGFISHDRDVTISGLRYRAAPGMIPSTISRSDNLDIDSAEIEGVLTSAAISEEDLISGRWDGALLYIALVNWEYPDAEAMPLICGEFGQITHSGDGFTVEMLGATSFLDAAVAPVTSPSCRAEFGDRHCKISRHRHQIELPVTGIADDQIICTGLLGQAARYGYGELRFLEGANAGLSFPILSGQGDAVRLAEQPLHPVAEAIRVRLTEGCDRNFSTCRDRFANSLNFRGEPYLPGNDLLTRYPGS